MPSSSTPPHARSPELPTGWFRPLDAVEWLGNQLPNPVTLFALGALLVMLVSALADHRQWHVVQELPQPVLEPVRDESGQPVRDSQTGHVVRQPVRDESGHPQLEWQPTGVVFRASSLISRDGIDWIFSSMVQNFIRFPPLGVVLVGMLGIGIAERTGLLGATLKALVLGLRRFLESFTPRRWRLADKVLTPAVMFVGIMSSLATDAGYVVLPPLAAALFKSVGRSPLAGLAASFAGVSAGFSANLLITGLEPMLAELTGMGASIVVPDYRVNPACNWWFMIVSTLVITLAGWLVTACFVERRLNRRSAEAGGPDRPSDAEMAAQQLTAREGRGLWRAGTALILTLGAALALILVPGAPLYTYHMPDPAGGPGWVIAELWEPDEELPESPPAEAHVRPDGRVLVPSERIFQRWVDAIVPLLFFSFMIPGLAYGIAVGEIRSDRDAAGCMIQAIAAMATIIVLAFVAGQFIEFFRYSGLDQMMAMAGGIWLGKAGLSPFVLVVAFIGVTMVFNLFMGSMSAKYALFAPIFVPMFMLVGIRPELTQAAYRVGDSVTNIITPLNSYLIIILVYLQRYVPRGGVGTMIATMLPYTLAFTGIWTLLLLIWMASGLPLGLDGHLWFDLSELATG